MPHFFSKVSIFLKHVLLFFLIFHVDMLTFFTILTVVLAVSSWTVASPTCSFEASGHTFDLSPLQAAIEAYVSCLFEAAPVLKNDFV